MEKKQKILEKVCIFIEKIYGDPVNENTMLEQDYGITGDEAAEFLDKYGKTFNVDLSNFIFDDYFKYEWIDIISRILEFLKLREPVIRKSLTIHHLVKGIYAGRLDDEVINSPLPDDLTKSKNGISLKS